MGGESILSPDPWPLGPASWPLSPVSCLPKARGWTFPPDIVFDRARVVALLASPELVRAKGVFRTPHEWYAVNRARASAPTVTPTAHRRDSRVEAFAEAPDWAAFERELNAAILPPR